MKLLLPLLLISIPAMAQPLPRIDTDRPHRTLSSSVVPQGRVQIETGLQVAGGFDTYLSVPAVLLRWAPVEWMEARVIADYMIPSYRDWMIVYSVPGRGLVRDVPTAGFTYGVGAKIQLLRESGQIPELALIAQLIHEFDSFEEYGAAPFAPDVRLAMGNRHQNGLFLGYNLGAKVEPWTKSWYGIYSFDLGFTFYSGVKGYVELFGNYALNDSTLSTMSYDLGLVWPVQDNLQLDISIGGGIADPAPDYYFGLGASARLPD